MLWLLKKAVERLKTLLVADAALDLEAEFLTRHADRKVNLLRKAHDYEEQGLRELADELRDQASELSVERPLSSILPGLGHLNGETMEADPLKLESSSNRQNGISPTNTKTKRAKKVVRTKAR